MRTWTLMLALSCGTLGCTDLLGGDDKSDDEDEDEDDGGWGEDGGSGGGGVGGGGGGGGSACSNVFPLDKVGRTLTYVDEDTRDDFVGEYSLTYMGQEDFEGEEGAWRLDGTYSTEGVGLGYEYTSDYSTSNWYRCDDEGVWVLGSTFEQTTNVDGTISDYWSETLYTVPGLSTPALVQDGTTWSFDYAFVQTSSYGDTTEYSYAIDYEVDGTQAVTVPAGTFDAFRVTYEIEGTGYEYFMADDVGTLVSSGYELVSLED